MRKSIVLLGFAVVVAVGIIFFGTKKNAVAPPEGGNAKAYMNLEYGLSFAYPASYFLTERNLSTSERKRFEVMLVEDTKENHDVLDGKSPGREGPTAITFTLYQNNLDKYSVESWIKGTSDSNYKLSPDGEIISSVVSGKPAMRYHWSGLYEADNVVFEDGDYIVSAVVTYIGQDDQIRRDFEEILKTVKGK